MVEHQSSVNPIRFFTTGKKGSKKGSTVHPFRDNGMAQTAKCSKLIHSMLYTIF